MSRKNEWYGYETKKHRLAPKIAGIAGVAVVAAGGCAAAYALSDTVKNQAKLAFSDPKEYFEWVYDKNITDACTLIESAAAEAETRAAGGQNVDAEMRFTLSDSARAELKELFPGSMLGSQIGDPITRIEEETETISLKINAAATDQAGTVQMSLLRNDKNIITAEGAADLAAQQSFCRLPDLNERWIRTDYGELLAENGLEVPKFTKQERPSPAEASQTFDKYSRMLIQDFETFNIEKHAEVPIGSIVTNYTALDAEIPAKQAFGVLLQMTEAARSDTVLKKIMPMQEAYDKFLDQSEESIRAGMENFEDADTVNLTTYVDATGTIRGWNCKSDDVTFFAAAGMSDGNYALELRCLDDAECGLRMTADAQKQDSGLNGTMVCSVNKGIGDPDEVKAAFSDIVFSENGRGMLSGKVTVTNPETDPIDLTFDADGDTQKVSFPVTVKGTDYGEFMLICTQKDAAAPVLPDADSAYRLSPDEPDKAFTEYTDQKSLLRFAGKVLEGIGFTEQEADSVTGSIGAMLTLS